MADDGSSTSKVALLCAEFGEERLALIVETITGRTAQIAGEMGITCAPHSS